MEALGYQKSFRGQMLGDDQGRGLRSGPPPQAGGNGVNFRELSATWKGLITFPWMICLG